MDSLEILVESKSSENQHPFIVLTVPLRKSDTSTVQHREKNLLPVTIFILNYFIIRSLLLNVRCILLKKQNTLGK